MPLQCAIIIEELENGFIVSADASRQYPPARKYYASQDEVVADATNLINTAFQRGQDYETQQQAFAAQSRQNVTQL